MKILLIKMIIVGTMVMSILGSCSKDSADARVPDPGGPPPPRRTNTLYLTTNHWDRVADGIFVCVFPNVIPSGNANKPLDVYVVSNGKDIPIYQAIPFMTGQLWATNTETDVAINYRGGFQNGPYLIIKVVFQ